MKSGTPVVDEFGHRAQSRNDSRRSLSERLDHDARTILVTFGRQYQAQGVTDQRIDDLERLRAEPMNSRVATRRLLYGCGHGPVSDDLQRDQVVVLAPSADQCRQALLG